MSYYVGVWNSATAVSDDEAAARYRELNDEKSVEPDFDDHVYTFYSRLISLFPEVETVLEDELDSCPWACCIDIAADHVILPILPEQAPKIMGQIVSLAARYELVCFDPQAGKAYLPPRLEPKRAAGALGSVCTSGSQPATIQLTGEPKASERESLQPDLDSGAEVSAVGTVAPPAPDRPFPPPGHAPIRIRRNLWVARRHPNAVPGAEAGRLRWARLSFPKAPERWIV
jgi:hypothetical protein